MELSSVQRLAVLTAMKESVEQAIASARTDADDKLAALYESHGADRQRVVIGGEQAGTFILNMTKEGWAVTDLEAFEDFALTYGFARESLSIRPEYMAQAAKVMQAEHPASVETKVVLDDKWERFVENVDGVPCYMDSGQAIPGLEWVPPRIKGTQLRDCDPKTVFHAIRKLGINADALLEGGGE